MKHPWLASLKVPARGLMVVAAMLFAIQGTLSVSAKAAESLASGPAIWHAHVNNDGQKHVHVHPIDPDDGGHIDRDGKLKGCAAVSLAAMPSIPSVSAPPAMSDSFFDLNALLPPGLDSGGLQRPPRIPSIG
jgi:hypothetical protein